MDVKGFAQGSPYNGIVVAAAAPFIPAPLRLQLANGGRLVIPVGGPEGQRLLIVTRQGDTFTEEKDGDVPVRAFAGGGFGIRSTGSLVVI